MVAIVQPSFSWVIPLACPAALAKRLFTADRAEARGTCDVAPITPKLEPSSFHSYGALNDTSAVPIGTNPRAPDAKMFGQT